VPTAAHAEVASENEPALEAEEEVLADRLHREQPAPVEPLGQALRGRLRVGCLHRNTLAHEHLEPPRRAVERIALWHGCTSVASYARGVAGWPASAAELRAAQLELASAAPSPWSSGVRPLVGACFVCFGRGKTGVGAAGDPGWAGAALVDGRTAVAAGPAGAPYEPGLLALREGPLLEAAVRALRQQPEVLIVNATGRDHPRRAGLALHLGVKLGLPSIGVTHRLLAASGDWPPDERGGRSPFTLAGEVAGAWLRTRSGTRPLAVHPGWRTDVDTAVALVLALTGQRRTPEPLRLARTVARVARARVEGGR
jgi:deoxyribonuclease V